MQFAQLRAFHGVAVEGGFTRAASALGITQPTLSAHIRALEEGYGIKLFERGGRNVHLTALGRELMSVVGPMFTLEDEARRILGGALDLDDGRLLLGADNPIAAMRLMRRFRDAYPKVGLSLAVGNAQRVIELLTTYRCDVAILAELPGNDVKMHAALIGIDQIVAIAPSSMPPLPTDGVSLEEFAEFTLIRREAGSRTQRILDEALAARGIEPAAEIEVESREAMTEAVAMGLGVGAIASIEAPTDPRTQTAPLENGALKSPQHIVCLNARRRRPVVRAAFAMMDVASAP